MTAEHFVWALCNAGTQAAGLWEFNADGSLSKHLHAGHAAVAGVQAAELTAGGFTGPPAILEGDRGFFRATVPDAVPARVIQDLVAQPQTYKISGVSPKPHASCRHTRAAIDAALALRDEPDALSPRQIKVATYQAALDLCDNPAPKTSYAAKLSLQYCVAAALVRGQAGLDAFSDSARAEVTGAVELPSVRVRLDPDFEQQYPSAWSTRVTLSGASGNTVSATVVHPKGDPENPLTAAEIVAKFRHLAAFGGVEWQVAAWLDWHWQLGAAARFPALPALDSKVPAHTIACSETNHSDSLL